VIDSEHIVKSPVAGFGETASILLPAFVMPNPVLHHVAPPPPFGGIAAGGGYLRINEKIRPYVKNISDLIRYVYISIYE
jgi:hypothetical protein